jgi:hypothetical protein
MVVKNFPAFGSALHDQREWPTRGYLAAPLQDEPRGHQGQGRAEGPSFDLLEVEAITPGAG